MARETKLAVPQTELFWFDETTGTSKPVSVDSQGRLEVVDVSNQQSNNSVNIKSHQFTIAPAQVVADTPVNIEVPITSGRTAQVLGFRIYSDALTVGTGTPAQKAWIGYRVGNPVVDVEVFSAIQKDPTKVFGYTEGSPSEGVAVAGDFKNAVFDNANKLYISYQLQGDGSITSDVRIDVIVKEV